MDLALVLTKGEGQPRRPTPQRSASVNLGKSPVESDAGGLAGYMFKQGPKENLMKRRWHKRWFYQRNFKLFYYKCKGDQLEKGCIDLELCTDFRKVDATLVLELVTPRRVYSLKCASDASFQYWKKGLEPLVREAFSARPHVPSFSGYSSGDELPDELVEDLSSKDKRMSSRPAFGTIRKLLKSSLTSEPLREADFVISRTDGSDSDDASRAEEGFLSSTEQSLPSPTASAVAGATAKATGARREDVARPNSFPVITQQTSTLRTSGEIIQGAPGRRPLPMPPGGGGKPLPPPPTKALAAAVVPAQSRAVSIAAPSPEEARTNVAKEILSTEEYFVHCMEELLAKYELPMRTSGLVSEEMLGILFFKLQELVEGNRALASSLTTQLENWDNDQTLLSSSFVDFIPKLKLFGHYGKNYDDAMATLAKLLKNPQVAELISQCDSSTDLKPRLADLLIAPVQRVPRYRLLFMDLLKKTTDDHPDYAGIQRVLSGFEAMANELNDEIRLGNNNRRFLSMKGKGAKNLLSAAERDLLKEGQLFLEAKKIKYKLYLFTDILVHITEAKSRLKSNISKPEFQWPLYLVWCKPPNNLNYAHPKYGYGFQLIGPGKLFVLRCPTKEERDSWVEALEAAIDSDIKARTYPPDIDTSLLSSKLDLRYGCYRYPKGGEYAGWWFDGLRQGTGTFTFFDYCYEGEWDKDQKAGQGTMEYPNGSTYLGKWVDDLPNGQGIYTAACGDVYEGSFRFGKFSGNGKLTYQCGAVYEGGWDQSLPHGEGTFVESSGSKYVGQWRNGQQHGEGVLEQGDVKYAGYFRFGQRDGKGKQEEPGIAYEGYWKAGQRSGMGSQVDSWGSYEGNWEKNLRQGRGQQFFENGDSYVGDWDRNQYDGKGKFTSKTGFLVEYDGNWEKHKKVGKGAALFRDGTRYEGAWKGDQMHGSGVLSEPDSGMVLDGKWREGRLEGNASVMNSTGNTYSGQFKNGQLCSSSKGRPGIIVPETPCICLPQIL